MLGSFRWRLVFECTVPSLFRTIARGEIVDARTNLIAKIRAQGLPSPDRPLPIVPLEDFFTGNNDFGSIGCNLANHPGPQWFFRTLKEIRDRPTVQNVLVEINEVVEEDPQAWPFSDRVYILTSASREDVKEWVTKLQPDEVEPAWTNGLPANAPVLPNGTKAYAVWWD
jgi:hypothetical protein